MSDELKPCPFCGGEGRVWFFNDLQGYGVECSGTSCGTEVTDCDNEVHAIKKWNTRPIEDALRARIAELEDFKASVPWDDLSVLLMGTRGIDGLYDFRKVVVDWFNAHAPKEPTA